MSSSEDDAPAEMMENLKLCMVLKSGVYIVRESPYMNSKTSKDFLEFEESLNERYLKKFRIREVEPISVPDINEDVVVLRDSRCYRGIVKKKRLEKICEFAKIFLIDYGYDIEAPPALIYHMTSKMDIKYASASHQAKFVCLEDIVPSSLTYTFSSGEVKLQPKKSTVWDESAIKFLNQLRELTSVVHFQNLSTINDDVPDQLFFGNLYVDVNDALLMLINSYNKSYVPKSRRESIGDILVACGFALKKSEISKEDQVPDLFPEFPSQMKKDFMITSSPNEDILETENSKSQLIELQKQIQELELFHPVTREGANRMSSPSPNTSFEVGPSDHRANLRNGQPTSFCDVSGSTLPSQLQSETHSPAFKKEIRRTPKGRGLLSIKSPYNSTSTMNVSPGRKKIHANQNDELLDIPNPVDEKNIGFHSHHFSLSETEVFSNAEDEGSSPVLSVTTSDVNKVDVADHLAEINSSGTEVRSFSSTQMKKNNELIRSQVQNLSYRINYSASPVDFKKNSVREYEKSLSLKSSKDKEKNSKGCKDNNFSVIHTVVSEEMQVSSTLNSSKDEMSISKADNKETCSSVSLKDWDTKEILPSCQFSIKNKNNISNSIEDKSLSAIPLNSLESMHSAATSNFFAALTSPGMHAEHSVSDGIDESDLSYGKIDHSFVTSKEESPKLTQPILELPVAHSVDKNQSKTVSDRIRKSRSRELKIPDEGDRYELASENNRRARLPLSYSPKHFYDSPCRSIISNSTFPFNCNNSKLPQWVSSKLVSSLSPVNKVSPTVCNQESSDSLTSSLSDSCNSLNVCTATTGTDETSPDDNRTDGTPVMLQNLQTKEAALEFSNAKYCKKKVKCDISGQSLGQDMVKSYRVYNGGDEAITIKQAVIHENEIKSILNDRIVNVLKDEQGQIQVRRIQSFAWPAISNDGSACILISGKRSGKTLGYSVPLVSNLLDNLMQKKKKHSLGAGPLMIVLCSTWKKVEQVDSYFNNLVPNGSSQIKIFSAWGGLGVERENDFKRQILTGCDILITTTPCLSRLIESDEESELACISFRKCSYLVIDDADEIGKLNYEHITSILHEWNSSFTKWGCDDSKQLVITGSIWSKQILQIYETISKIFQTRIIISAHLEAAVAVKVHNIIHPVRPNQCPCSVALNLIKDSNMNHKTIIFVGSNVEGKRMKNLLGSVAISVEMVAAEELMWRVRDTISKWRQASSLVIIVSDKHFNQLYQFDLIDADTIFQIGVPESELLFGRRYSFMLGNYSSNLHKKSEVISHVILSSEMIRSNSYVIGCLERMGATIPLELENVKVESIISEIKRNESTELCHYVKGIGKCYKRKCIWRHSIVLRDAPITVPTEGEVEFQVIDVIDASRYSVLLTKYIDSETKIEMELAHFYTILHMKLQQYYSVPKHLKALEDAVVGMMCASCMPVKFWARGKILKIDNESKYITVFFIDEGFVKTLKNSSTLFYLPEKLKVMPQLCVEVYLCNVKPVDNDSTWTLAANNAIKNILQNPKNDVSTIFRGKIKFALNNILWLGPIKPMIRIGSRICPKVALRNELITSKYGENNPSHMQDIQNLYEESELPTINLSRESWLEHYVLGETSLASSKRKVELKESLDKSSPGVKSVSSCTVNVQKLCNETLCNQHSKSIFFDVRSCSSTVNDFLNDVTRSCEQSNVPSDILGKPDISQTSTNKIQSGIIADFYMKEQRSIQVVELEKNLQLNLDGKNRNIQYIQKESKMEGNFEDNCSLIKQQILKSDSLDSEVKHPKIQLKTVKKLVRKPGMIANASISIVKHLDESPQHCSKIDLNGSLASKLPIEELCSMTVIKTRENHLEKEVVNDLLLTVDSEKAILQPHRKESTIKNDCNLVEAQFVDIGEVNSKLYVDRKKSSAIVSCEAKANSSNIFTKELDANLGSMSSTNDNLIDALDRSSMISNGDVATNLLNEPLVEDLINFDDDILESEKNLSTQTISVKEEPKPSKELSIPQNSIYDMGPTFDSFAEMELFSIHDEHNVESLSTVNNAAVVYGNNRPALNNSKEKNSTVGEERMSIGDILQVEVGEIVSPLQFYIMKAKNSNLLSQLEDEIQTLIVNLNVFDGVSAGNICLAKFDDGRFYRGEVVNAQDTYCQIFYLDHGETREVDKKEIYPCPEHVFNSLPFQCLECQLANIDVPEDLLTKATDTMEMIVDHTSVWMAQVLDFELQKNKVLYIVDLLDTTRPKNKLLVQYLIDKQVVLSNGKQLGYDNGDLKISEVTENKPLITCKVAGEFSVSDSSLKQSQHPEVKLKESLIKTASLSVTAVTENGMVILDASDKHQKKLTNDCNSVAPITLNKDSGELPYVAEASLQCLDFSEMPPEKCTDLTDLAEKCCFTQENVVRDRLLALRNFYSAIDRLVPTLEALPNNSSVSVKRSSAQLSNVLDEGLNIVSISDPVMEVSLNDFSMQLNHKTESLGLQHPEKEPSEESKDAFALKTSANEVLTEVDFAKPNTDICNTTYIQDKETQNVNHEIISNPYLFNKISLVALQECVSVAAQQERVSIAAHQDHASVAAHQEHVSLAAHQERVLIADNAHFLSNDTTLKTSARSIKALTDFTGIVAKQENQQSESDEIILKEKYYSSSLESLSVNSLTNLTNSNDTTRCRSELVTQSPVSLNLKSSSSEIEVPSSSFSENSPFSKPKLADKWSRRPDQGKKKAKRFNGAKRIQKHQVIPQSFDQGNLLLHINDEMPSLEDLETMTQILHPETYWKQDEERIYLRICLPDISEYECRIHSDKLIFQTSVKDIWYIFHEELFSAIDPDLSYIKTYGLFTSITLKKQQKEMWLRLLAKEGRVPWLRKDMSVTLVDDNDTDTSDDGSFRFPTRGSNHSSNSEDELKKYTMLPSEPSDDESNNYSSSDDDIFKFA